MRDGRSDGGRGVGVQRTLICVVAELMVHSYAATDLSAQISHIRWL